jgi:glucans biosynthesis protein
MTNNPERNFYQEEGKRGQRRFGGRPAIGSCAVLCLLVQALAGRTSFAATNAAPPAFTFETLRNEAKALAAQEYKQQTQPEVPDFIRNLTYDQYQCIRFRPEQSPWSQKQLRFSLEFFHRGYLYADPVRIHLLESGKLRDLPFSPELFDYGNNHFAKPISGDLGFAGFRVVYIPWLDQRQKKAEVGSFLGASYFRLVGLRQRYGSAFRGLAIDTGEASGEEFPRFKEFWIEEPDAAASHIQCYALLDSPSCAGAYRFVITAGDDTVSEMEASLFVRKGGKKIGLAPLTSMFLMGKNRSRFIPDFRPEVHDADGLLVGTSGGEWLWRPLVNPPKTHQIQRFPVEGLAGFGLLQRERDFHSYEDLEARYDLRPSLWVQPEGNWGPGTVELVEIPSPNEANDNIVAYWVPKEKIAPGQELHWTGKLSALLQGPDQGSLARAVSTRISPPHDKAPARFVLDFTGAKLPALAPGERMEAKAQVSRGKIENLTTQTNEVTGGWRVFFDLGEIEREPIELRLFLHRSGKPLSETWVYRYQAE